MPLLCWGGFPTLGTGAKASQGYSLSEGTSVSLSLLQVQADIPTLSRRDDESGSDRAVAAICSDLLEIEVKLSRREYDLERLEDRVVCDDDLAEVCL